jgi:hypothetical protein
VDRRRDPGCGHDDPGDLNPDCAEHAEWFNDVGPLQDCSANRYHKGDWETYSGDPFQRTDPAAGAAKAGGSGTPVL